MKKILVPMILLFIPLVILAGIFDKPGVMRLRPSQSNNRAYRIAQQIYSSKDAGQWIPNSRANFFYSSSQTVQPDSMHMDMYEPELEVWIPAMMVAYIYYNDNGYVSENVIYMNFMGSMMPMMKTMAVYDNQNRITKLYGYSGGSMEQNRDPELWEPFSRLHIYYDGPAVSVVYRWEEAEEFRPAMFFKSTFEFDGQGRIITEYTDASNDSLNWSPDDKFTRSFHPNDTSNGLQFIEYMSQNLPFMLLNDGFDFPGMITEEMEYDWENSAWQASNKNVSEFNAQNQRTISTYYYWNMNQWQNSDRKLYSYDPSGNLSSEIEQEYSGTEFVDMDKVDYIWETYTANEDPAQIPPVDFGLKLYPVPFGSELNIESFSRTDEEMEISIYNVRGQLVQSFLTHPGTTINWNSDANARSTAPGIYFVTSKMGNRVNSYKVVKTR